MRLRSTLLALASVAMFPLAADAADCPTDLPDTMRAVRMHDYGGPEQLRIDTIPRPTPAAGEVLVEVHAASVNPIDWKLREGLARNWWPLDLPAVPGRDGAGVVVAVGSGVTDLACGDAVVVMIENRSSQGTYAEYVAAKRTDVARKPEKLSFAEAAAYPLVAVTAFNAVDTARVKSGDRVLVHGGAGGVGSMAVQIAKARGAHVTTTASARNAGFVKSIGADAAIDYRAVKFEDAIDDVDAVIDAVGGETTPRSVAVVKRGGRLVSVAGGVSAAACRDAGIECLGADAGNAAKALPEIGRLIDAGQLAVSVEKTFPLAEAAAAQEQNRAGHTRGKLVVTLR